MFLKERLNGYRKTPLYNAMSHSQYKLAGTSNLVNCIDRRGPRAVAADVGTAAGGRPEFRSCDWNPDDVLTFQSSLLRAYAEIISDERPSCHLL